MDSSSTLSKSLRFVASRTLLILFGFLFALVLAEIALRIFAMPRRVVLLERLEQQWQADDELLIRMKSNLDLDIYGHPDFSYTVRTNADGARDEPFVGTFDIATLGDSFTFGFGVEEQQSWPARLEAMSGARVANLGWEGWNSHLYPVAIRRHAVPLQTRIWLWTFVNNDLTESASAEEFLLSGEKDYVDWVKADRALVSRLSFPFNLRVIQMVSILLSPDLFMLPNSGEQVKDSGELDMRIAYYDWDVTEPNDPRVQRGWELTEAALAETRELAAQQGATLVVIYVPAREHVYWPYIKDLVQDVDVEQLDEVEARLASFCEANSIRYLNLLPEMQNRALEGERLYFPIDGHWNAAGHELAAQIVYDMLLREELLAPR